MITRIRQPNRLSINQASNEPLRVEIYLDDKGEASGTLYMDDGNSFAYKQGKEMVYASLKYTKDQLSIKIE